MEPALQHSALRTKERSDDRIYSRSIFIRPLVAAERTATPSKAESRDRPADRYLVIGGILERSSGPFRERRQIADEALPDAWTRGSISQNDLKVRWMKTRLSNEGLKALQHEAI